jgi:type IV pilus assembly protein PilQ
MKLIALLVVCVCLRGRNCLCEDSAPRTAPPGLILTLEDVDIQTVVGGLARQNHVNLVGVDKLKGKVTAYLSNVSVQDALDAILKSKGFSLRNTGGIWEIVEVRPEEKKEKEAQSQGTSPDDQASLGQFSVRYAELDRVVAALVPSVIPEGSRIARDSESGVLLVRGTPNQLAEVDRVLSLIDVRTPQILIRTKIFEVSQDRADELGIEWKKISLKEPQSIQMDLTQPVDKPSFMWGYVRGDVEVSLKAMVDRKAADILSEPQVTTTNNRPATIRVADRVPVIKRTLQIVNQQSITTDEVTFEDAGLSLQVTPRVVGDNHVFLKLLPAVRELVGYTDTVPPQPIINTREATTDVMIQDGAWLVIGGLMRNSKTNNKRKVPIVGSIPLLGLPFRSQTGKTEKSNLLILVSATVLDDMSAARQARQASDEAQKFGEKSKHDWVGYRAVREDVAGLVEMPGPKDNENKATGGSEPGAKKTRGNSSKKSPASVRRDSGEETGQEP